MTVTGLEAFDTTLQTTNLWLKELMAELGWQDRHKAYMGLRLTLHALRDRLTVAEAVQLGAQLPMLIRGFYYEGWTPAGKPLKERHKESFLAPLRDYFGIDAERVARAVFKVLERRISAGELADIKSLLPHELNELWPESIEKG